MPRIMIFKGVRRLFWVLKLEMVILVLFVGLYGSCTVMQSSVVFKQLNVFFKNETTQRILLVCALAVPVMSCLGHTIKSPQSFFNYNNPGIWLTNAILFALSASFLRGMPPNGTAPALILAGTFAIGRCVAFCVSSETTAKDVLTVTILIVIMVFFAFTSLWNIEMPLVYNYHRILRWSGPWANPNMFGILMGTGIILAIGCGLFILRRQVLIGGEHREHICLSGGKVVLLALLIGLMSRGLLRSYSRGAWLGTLCGGIYLTEIMVNFDWSKFKAWVRSSMGPLAITFLVVVVVIGVTVRYADKSVIKRAISAVNPNDFSTQNRLAAWKGALQMLADEPWFGFGWNQPDIIYDSYYSTTKIYGPQAIQVNDLFMFGITLGCPALICFGMYLWLSLKRRTECQGERLEDDTPKPAASKPKVLALEVLQSTCRAGAIVLLVGFWFDGGLFEMPTAVIFWLLLELGAMNRQKGTAVTAEEAGLSRIDMTT